MVHRLIVIACMLIGGTLTARANDGFWSVPVGQLHITEGSLPATTEQAVQSWVEPWDEPYAVIDGGEAFIQNPQMTPELARSANGIARPETMLVCVRAPTGKAISGRIYLPKADHHGMTSARFTIPADDAKADARKDFYTAQNEHYQFLVNQQIAGGAWFRYRANEAREALGKEAAQDDNHQQGRPSTDDLDDSYALFTGGRAVSENLQLDRAIGATKDEPQTEEVGQINNISIAEMDWKPLIKDLHPAVDPLANILPADQHAVFFPSFNAFTHVIELADKNGTPVLQLAEPRSEDAQTQSHYQRQLGVELNDFSKLIGPAMVDAVVITGSDAYLRVGSDVAILFQTKNPDALTKLLQTKIALSAGGADHKDGDIAGLHYTSWRNADRTVSSYLAATDGAVIVTNSPMQLQRIGEVIGKKSAALATAPEYIYFRNRYRLGDGDESAFVILTDATIRRWCSARWRIADARRTRAAAVMADVQARHMNDLLAGKVTPTTIEWEMPHQTFGDLTINSAGVSSNIYGSLNFMTPISELPIAKVTKSERTAYERWRNQYQSDWRWAFDPIAARLGDTNQSLSLDLTVLPLIVATDYREIVNFTKSSKLAPGAGDPHADLLQYTLSMNHDSSFFGLGNMFSSGLSPKIGMNPLSWVGTWATAYLDDDPFWDEVAKQKSNQLDSFWEKNYMRIPAAIAIESTNGLKLAAFVTGLRAYIEQSAPQMTVWESVPYHDKAYVKITASADAQQSAPQIANAALYYATTPKALIVSLDHSVIERALDRQAAATQPSHAASAPTSQPSVGENFTVHADQKLLTLLQQVYGDDYTTTVRNKSWQNIPILNEWKHRYPDQDPVIVHEKVWSTKLIDPAGGTYVWNEKNQTMESTIAGSPTSPKELEHLEMPFKNFHQFDAGLTFEQQGLRAKVQFVK